MAVHPLRVFTRAVAERADVETAAALVALDHAGLRTTGCSTNDLARGRVVVDRSTIAIGGLRFITAALRQLGTSVPPPDDYPDEVRDLLGRSVRPATVGSLRRQMDGWPRFVKPRDARKRFTGRVFESPDDWPLTTLPDRMPVWSCDPVDWRSEWRVFVAGGDIVWMAHYDGEDRLVPDRGVIDRCIAALARRFDGFALDVGVLADGSTAVVELNDGFSIGTYGAPAEHVLAVLAARWSQLLGLPR